eukprot:gene38277-50223_t
MPAQVVGMLRIEVCDWEQSFSAEEQEQVAADLLRFHGRDLKEAVLFMMQSRVIIHEGGNRQPARSVALEERKSACEDAICGE